MDPSGRCRRPGQRRERPRAVAAGRRVEELAREGLASELGPRAASETTPEPAGDTPTAQATSDDAPTESFVDRIKAVLAA